MSYSSGRSTRFQQDSSSSKKFITSIKARKAELGLAENGDAQSSKDDVSVVSHNLREETSSFVVSSASGLASPTSTNMSGEIQSYIQNSSGKNRLPVPKKSFKNVTSPDKTVNLSVSGGGAPVAAPKTELDDVVAGDASLSETPCGEKESRKEAREAFLRSELGGVGKKLQEPLKDTEQQISTTTTHHEKDIINNMQKSSLTNLPSSATQLPMSSLPVVGNHVQLPNKNRLGRDQESYVGFANLPNQVYRKSVKKGFEFTLMLVGESGLGKSTLMNSMFLTDLYNSQNPGPSMRSQKTVKVEKMQVVLKEGGVQLKLTVVDTPGFGDSVDNTNCWNPIINYIDEQYNSYLNAESRVVRQMAEDTRVHCCLYFISPNGHGLRALDIEVMKQLHEKVNIIPLIAKADSMTLEECKSFKKIILEDINKHSIKIYEFPDCDDEEEQKAVKKMKERIPFAVVGSNTVIESGGRKVRARSYPWGVVEVENLEHNDFVALRNMLIRTHLHDLKDVTNNVHYENFRYDRLLTSVGPEKTDKTSLNKSPMLQIEEEKREHEEKLKKMEAEMHVVFEAKVKEKKNKLMESDLELQRRQEQLRKSLDQQESEYDNLKITFKSEKETWEEQIKQYEAEQTSTLRKKKTLFS